MRSRRRTRDLSHPLRRRRRHARAMCRQFRRGSQMAVELRLLSWQQTGEGTGSTAADFDQVRAGFEAAWRVFLAKRTEADFLAWRDQRDWTERKYAAWAAGERTLM
jgi:hypothetical protein